MIDDTRRALEQIALEGILDACLDGVRLDRLGAVVREAVLGAMALERSRIRAACESAESPEAFASWVAHGCE